MAEILLSLTIIGVVAAITLPSLTGNINERTWNTQRKALYARMSQALSLMPNLNGYGIGSTDNETIENAAMTFIANGLSKVLKINNICQYDSLADCGIPNNITTMGSSAEIIKSFNESNGQFTSLGGFNNMLTGTWNDGISGSGGTDYGCPQLDTKAAAFETANGESILVYYNPNCTSDMNEITSHYTQPKMCANFVYDLNGSKGPNTVGKDIGFITALYSSDPIVVAPLALQKNAGSSDQTNAGNLCKAQDEESRLPNRDELTAMFYNRTLLGIDSGYFWSGSVISSGESGTAWRQNFYAGWRSPITRKDSHDVRCVKR